ncbi:probable ubiquitin-like-specific protease 2A isoform X2 [Lycium ferocissimum]|uniref:probable ubiquitin-like-specific protease 2A isoform X2 n=1 Tax=Lycium ferocissimum TaxID=112874 RepID=UPI002815E5FC|nr:probable ubiquitin-like-specific protease 2A isoform X2 [Lycium ferocissimum]
MTKTRSKNRRNPSKHDRDRDLSVFDFSPEDQRIEKHAKKKLQTFKKSKKFDSPVDKYSFLHCFAGGISSLQNDSVNEILHIEDSDDIAEMKILESGATVASSSSHLKPLTDYCLNHLKLKCDTSGGKAQLTRVEVPGCSVTDGKIFSRRVFADNEPVILDSDDDTKIESSKPACYLPENKGSGNQQQLMQSPDLCDTKVPVVVRPDHIMYEDMYSTSSILTFSRSSIKLEGSFGMKLPVTSEWTLCDILAINSEWCKSVETALVELSLKSKDADVAKTDNENSGAIVLSLTLFDPDWSETQEAIKMLDVRYKDKWNDTTAIDCTRSYSPFFGQKSFSVSEHHHPNSRDNLEEIIFPEGDPDAISISKRDVDLLKPKTFINDTIIDFYIMYLKNKMNPEEKDRFHFFNSFFFRKLADLDRDPSRACGGRSAFLRVRRWTAKVNIFGKEFIFVPVNFSLHWSLIVICHPGEVVTFREEEMEKSSRVPCILHMNSIQGSHKGLKNLIQSYLLEEWKERHKEVGEDVARKFSSLPFVCLELPQQENFFDCGLFLLHYVELFLEQAPVNFKLSLITASSKFLSKNWFSTEDVDCKREYIKRLICEITKNRVQKETWNAREACHGNDLSSHEDELLTLSPVANLIRGFKNAGVSEVSKDLSQAQDSARALTYDNYRLYGPKASLDPFRNVMSPIEEEAMGEHMTISPAMKAGSQPVDLFAAPHASSSVISETLFLRRISKSCNSEKINPRCRSSNCGVSLNSVEIHDEENRRAKVEEVSDPDAVKYDSQELAGYIVLDSQEEKENHDWNCLANNLPNTSSCHREASSTDIYVYKVDEKILPSRLIEQAAKKPRHVPEVLEVSSSGKGKDQIASSSTSSEELAGYIVLDSQEEKENHDWNCLANNLPNTSSCHREVSSTDFYVYEVDEKILPSRLIEQAAKKPRHVPEVLEVSSSGKGKDQIASSSTSSEEPACFVLDSEEVDSKLYTEAINLKPATGSGNKPVAGKTSLFRRPRRGRIVLS